MEKTGDSLKAAGAEPSGLHPAWCAFIRYCRELKHGEIERLSIQDGLPLLAATAYHNLGTLSQDTGRCDAAAGAYQHSVELWQRAGAGVETYLLRTANGLVGLYLACGAVREAERHERTLVAPLVAARPGGGL